MARKKNSAPMVCSILGEHFAGIHVHELVTAVRQFPITARLDLQTAVAAALSELPGPIKVMGLHAPYGNQEMTFASLSSEHDYGALVAPLQYDEIDIGTANPSRCLKEALWLGSVDGDSYALLLTPLLKYGQPNGVRLEVAVPVGEVGAVFSQRLMAGIEKKVNEAGSYRGKVLSLEAPDNYTGAANGVTVHRLRQVRREEVILPEKTLQLLERNVTRFIEQRAQLGAMRLGVKKGLLFYGPPGTGKTHTIHYLASQMKDHTTLLITAEQVGLLDQYMQLARFLQPAMVVIEDVDLIAKARTSMRSPCEESMLNKLLNEMDGLREDAMVLFILTTNRPDQLEAALASRPGRIDQAIEFPLPDEKGRQKLIRLYSGGMPISEDLLAFMVRKTRNGSAALIKELMRRSAQFLLESKEQALSEKHVEAALDEMLFSGGTLNSKLLGIAEPAQ